MSRVEFGQVNENASKFKKKKKKVFYIVAFLVCQEYPIIYANGRLACLILACRQNMLQGMLGVLVDLPRRGRLRVTPLYHEHASAGERFTCMTSLRQMRFKATSSSKSS